MPTPCPQPRPLTRKVVAVTAAGVVGAGARTAAGAGTASARPRPVRTSRSGAWRPAAEASEEARDSRGSLPNLQLAGAARVRFRRLRRGQAVVVDERRLPERYRNPERIARGGMGEVYRAEDAAPRRASSPSSCSPGRYADDEAVRGRFTREALAAARLSQAPNTVTIFDVGEQEGRPYIVMEYLPGGSLADRLEREGAQPVGRALAWLGQAAAALDAAHANGIVHRDVKPANLLLDSDERVKVADFGVASAAGLGSFTEVGHGRRHRRLPRAGAGARRARRPRERPLRPRGRRLRAAHRQAAVRARVDDGRGDGARERADPAGLGVEPGPAARARRRPRARPREGARAPVRAPPPSSCGAARRARPGRPGRRRSRRSRRLRRRAQTPPLAAAARCSSAARSLAGVLAAALLAGDDGETTARTTAPPRRFRRRSRCRARPSSDRDDRARAAPGDHDGRGAARARSPSELNDQGFALMQAGDYEEALPLLEQAVAGLAGSGELTEAYASYNLAFTRLRLGQLRRRRRAARPLGSRSREAEGDQQAAEGGRAELRGGRGLSRRGARRTGARSTRGTRPSLDRLPPVAVLAVPGDGPREALRERVSAAPSRAPRGASSCRASSGGRGRRGPRRGGRATASAPVCSRTSCVISRFSRSSPPPML